MYKVYTGETVEDALQKGLSDLNVEENDINIDVLEEGSKGFLGFMKKEAKVKLTIINPELKQLDSIEDIQTVSYTHLTLPTILRSCRSRWSPYH